MIVRTRLNHLQTPQCLDSRSTTALRSGACSGSGSQSSGSGSGSGVGSGAGIVSVAFSGELAVVMPSTD